MRIIHAKPPIYDEAKKVFGDVVDTSIFTYGDTIFNPGGITITPDMQFHEEVHARQQEHNEGVARLWWTKYLADSTFRIGEEVEAYGAQYRFICKKVHDKNERFRYLNALAALLSGPIYGNALCKTVAIDLIRDTAENKKINTKI